MFKGKVVLITGASSGIGAQTALDFSKQEALLVIVGRNKENLDKVASKCKDMSPKKLNPLSIIADVSNECDVERMIKTTIEVHSKLDILVNNAGIFETGSIETTSLHQYDRIMNTNVRGSYHLTMLAVPHLIKSKGNIVNVSSIAGLRSVQNFLTYCMSKAALDQFTKCVALELGLKGVRVNSVNPGTIDTGIHLKGVMTEEQYTLHLEKCKTLHAIGRHGEASEVSSVILFLASEAASNVTGVILPVDGGRHVICP